ncbi:uncharacterized protein LOC126322598 [Schistocerca gregaria]|uniref:uncharacterized protein LOC126322598 n=1 Tax=Schistocerca gregaria TaxID=7010 RepID=UPI00211DE90C|nr:uncharacterized protein LOC126322598 [Schistocerca gregaria]
MASKKESILDLDRHIDKEVYVKFNGGREVRGILRGFDPLVNLVLDECVEYLHDQREDGTFGEATRKLGRVLCRGLVVMCISPVEGFEQLTKNPFECHDTNAQASG